MYLFARPTVNQSLTDVATVPKEIKIKSNQIISKSQVGLGDIVDVFEKHGKKNLEGEGVEHTPPMWIRVKKEDFVRKTLYVSLAN